MLLLLKEIGDPTGLETRKYSLLQDLGSVNKLVVYFTYNRIGRFGTSVQNDLLKNCYWLE